MGKHTKSVRIAGEDQNCLIDDAAPMPQVDEKEPFYTIEMQEHDSNSSNSSEETKLQQDDTSTLRFPPVKLKDDSNWIYADDTSMYNVYGDPFGGANPDDDDDDDDTYNNSLDLTSKDANDKKSTNNHYPQADGQTHKKDVNRGDDDDDDEFDWNDDPDAPAKPKRRKTARERIQAVMKKPCCWHFLSPFMKRLIIAATGSLIFIAIAVSTYLLLPKPTTSEENNPDFANVRSNVQCWMYWAAFMWHIGWITTVFVEIVPSFVSLWTKIFVGRRSEKVKSSMEYYMSMKKYITIFLLGAWNWGSWAFLIKVPFSSVQKQDYSWIIWKVFACIFIATGLLFFQKLIIQVIATRFHRSAYSERIAENKHSLKVLDSLSKSEGRRSRSSSNNLNMRQRYTSNDSSQDFVAGGMNDSKYHSNEPTSYTSSYSSQPQKQQHAKGNTAERFNNFNKRIQGMVLTDKPQGLSRMETRKVDINSDDFAKKVAKKLFYSLAHPFGIPPPPPSHMTGLADGVKTLEKPHFRPYFKTEEQCTAAFEVFDRDGNGDVTRREFRDTVVQIYRERKRLAQCIRDTSQALGKIDIIFFILAMVISVFLCLTAIFNVNLYQALVPMGTFIMGLSFMFSNTVKVAFESIMFLFVTHPYDAGDNVLIDDVTLTVHNMGITGTVFIRGDGQMVYAPTTVLMTKLITNVRRSGDMGESITLNVDFRTSTDLVFTLREKLSTWVNDQPREYADGFDVRLQDIVDVNKLVLTIWLPHKGNWQNIGKRLQRRNRFMFMLKDTLDELKIHYELPAQRFTSNSNSDFFGNTNSLATETAQSFSSPGGVDPSSGGRPHNVRMYGYTQSTAADADGG